MMKIGEFSKMSKMTIKAIRYYEKENLLKPAFIDPDTNYRYYESSQLIDVSKIMHLKQAGLSIKDIKRVLSGNSLIEILENRKKEIEENIEKYNIELSKINYLLNEKNSQNEIFIKEIPSCIIYYRDGIISDFSKISEFAVLAGMECEKANPTLKCVIPNYSYISYLDGEYKEENIKIRYAEAVEKFGTETENIKFMKSNPFAAVCIYHKGSYDNLRNSYNIILKYIENNGYEIIDNARECYIDGCWNKDDEKDYLTEIEFPVKKRIDYEKNN